MLIETAGEVDVHIEDFWRNSKCPVKFKGRAIGTNGDSFQREEVEDQPKRSFTFATLFMKGHFPDQTLMKMEPFLRKVVREEVERAIVSHAHTSPSMDQFERPDGRTLQLRFSEKLPSVLFTNTRIGSEDGNRIRIDIWDVNSKKVVTSGSLSSIKAEIIVLHSDFEADDDDDDEDWTEEAFKTKIVREREGKRPLLTGELTTCLKDGVGYFGDISLSDNSSWVRSGKFRLGARIVPTASAKATRVREAVSQAFVVKDHRGESQKKHYPPRLGDETWRLKRISKDGMFHKRLTSEGIITVKDFLRSYNTDQSKLRQLLGGGGNSSKTLETIVEHAKTNTCPNAEMYVYYKEGETVGLIFDDVYKNVGATLNGENWVSLENLSALLMSVVERLKWDAYKNINQFVPFGGGVWSSLHEHEHEHEQLTDPFNKQSLGLGTEQLDDDHELKMQLVGGCDQLISSTTTEMKSELLNNDVLLLGNYNIMGGAAAAAAAGDDDPICICTGSGWGLDDHDPSMTLWPHPHI